MKIRTRILLGFLILYGAGFYYLVDLMVKEIRPRYLETVEESLNDTANILASMLEAEIRNGRPDASILRNAFPAVFGRKLSARIFGITKRAVDLNVYVTDSRGIVIYDSGDPGNVGKDFSQWNDVHLTLRGRYGARSTRKEKDNPATSRLHVAAPIRHLGRIIGVLTVVKPVDSVTLFIELAKQKIIIAGTVTCFAFIILSILLSFWINMPVRRLISYVSSLTKNRKPEKPSLGAPEIRALGDAFEEMKAELEGKRYIEQYVQSLTHELKSPLTSILGSAELLHERMPEAQKRRFYATILKESRRIDTLIQRLLELASLESRRGILDEEKVSIKPLIDEIAEGLSPQLHKKGIALMNGADPAHTVRGEKFLIRLALQNLIQNAVHFTGQRGRIEVLTRATDGFMEISIRDNGEGIPGFAIDKVFNKFYSLPRSDSKEKGTGLGLPFVKEVATLHGGSAVIANNEGPGVTATLRLPF